MTLTVVPGDPRDPQATALLLASHQLMQDLFPTESNHYLSIDGLCAPTIRFLVAMDGNALLGCAALALKPGYGEIKSMFVAQAARGEGVADAMMHGLIASGRSEGLPLLRLETGDTLYAAHRLYQKHGYKSCGPFGEYSADPVSLFMEKKL